MAKRCPACNANRNVEVEIGKDMKTGKSILGRRCVVCSATWMGNLYTPKEMEGFYE